MWIVTLINLLVTFVLESAFNGPNNNTHNVTPPFIPPYQTKNSSIIHPTHHNNTNYHQYESICKNAHIQMEYVDLGSNGGVCSVRESLSPSINIDLNWDSYLCDQAAFSDYDKKTENSPKSDACPLSLGRCNSTTGKCEGMNSENSYYWKTFGRRWNGIGTWSTVTLTQQVPNSHSDFLDDQCVNSQMGIDGVASVPPRMYGKWGLNSQSIVSNNDICYEIVGPSGNATVAIGGRCGGFSQCSPEEELEALFFDILGGLPQGINLAQQAPHIANTGWANSKQCQRGNAISIHAGITPSCKVQSPPEGLSGLGCCPGECKDDHNMAQQVDHCSMNDHPHFELTSKVFSKLCGSNTNDSKTCVAQHIKPIACPKWKPKVCSELNIKTCPPNSFISQLSTNCIPQSQGLYTDNGGFTQCCCDAGYWSSGEVENPQCLQQNVANCTCQDKKGMEQWGVYCSAQSSCFNETGCNQQSAYCDWIITPNSSNTNSTTNHSVNPTPPKTQFANILSSGSMMIIGYILLQIFIY